MSLGRLVCFFLLCFDLACCVSANSAVMPVSACAHSLRTCAFVSLCVIFVVYSSCVELLGFSLFSLMELLVQQSCGLEGLFQTVIGKQNYCNWTFSSGDVQLFPLCENCPSLNIATSTLLSYCGPSHKSTNIYVCL